MLETSAGIFVCIDANGQKSYSDKKCPPSNKKKSQVINDLGRTTVPDSILQFTAIIKVVKRTLRVVIDQSPDNGLYRRAYRYTQDAEVNHRKYLSKQHKNYPINYNPFAPIELSDIISAISGSCRINGFMTVCGAIESNYWLNGEEQIYLSKSRVSAYTNSTKGNDIALCNKAKRANYSGVVSGRVVDYFCKAI